MANLEQLNESRVEMALSYLSKTDEEHAYLSSEVKRLEELLKTVLARLFLENDGGVAEREQKARADGVYEQAVSEWAERWKEFKTVDNKRQHEIRIVEIFQTLSANRRRGNIL
jgi:hypothetical protein